MLQLPGVPQPGSLERSKPRILIWDVERSPMKSYHFGVWQVDVRRPAILERPRIFCFSWSWDDEDGVHFAHERGTHLITGPGEADVETSHRAMVMLAHQLLDQADRVVSYNGRKADTKWINTEFSKYGVAPPSDYKEIDLFLLGKRRFDLEFKGLDDLAKHLGVSRKGRVVDYFDTWARYEEGDKQALSDFRQYSIQDTLVTKEVWHELKPWV